MTALARLFRTTAFKLSLAYLVIFAIGSGLVLAGVGWTVKGLMDEQIAQTIEAEITGLSEQYAQGGLRRLVDVVERRAQAPGSDLYLITTFAGQTVTGNIAGLPSGVLDGPGVVETDYQRVGENAPTHQALARIFVLPGGFRLVVGHDLQDREALRSVIGRAHLSMILGLILVGTLGSVFVARRVLRHVDAISASARSIMAGDLQARLPMSGSQDELDRLALNLNAMLDRVSDLAKGLQEVSENIAHDLRTPLTRLRNSAEEALRSGQTVSDYRVAVERVMDEADGLIRIFNALLQIARTQAGSSLDGMQAFDLSQVMADVSELYEPVAEELHAKLMLDAAPGVMAIGHRELISQTLANLIDNALKYGLPIKTSETSMAQIDMALHVADGRVHVSVGDHGLGIPEADRARVLNRFVRLEPARSKPGSGLGLSMASAVAHLHGSDLTMADNRPGLRLSFSVPLAPADGSPQPHVPTSVESVSRS